MRNVGLHLAHAENLLDEAEDLIRGVGAGKPTFRKAELLIRLAGEFTLLAAVETDREVNGLPDEASGAALRA